jgi:hypothetical protein
MLIKISDTIDHTRTCLYFANTFYLM